MSAQKREVLRRELDSMIDNYIIEECESEWCSPVVLVPKKDGLWRVCIDYRKLNTITVPDHYPLPRIDDLLHFAKHTPFMSTLDLKAGYWQISVRTEDRDKTAFITPFGLYRCKRMPFGLRNAPATFQKLVERFRSGLNGMSLFAYLDDIILLSSDFESHVKELSAVFDRLELFKLKVNREKCQFACTEIKYLGHVLTPRGISVDTRKTDAICKMPPPRNIKHVKTFLQTFSWYRRFIERFADIARPLTDLLKKDAEWRWTEREQWAFEKLKRRLTSPPILRQADESLPFTLRTDASARAIGAVLCQGEAADERPIEYASRLLTAAERHYATTEREALAIVWAVGKFRGYIENSRVKIGTDHQPLRWLMSLQSPSGRLARWAPIFHPYDLEIEYTPGRINKVADTLSRPPYDESNAALCSVCTASVDLPSRNAMNIREEQLKDDEVAKIIRCFEDTATANPWAERGYMISGGVLYRYSLEGEHDEAQQVVPSHERARVLRKYHDVPIAGHYGVERTLARISSRYYWVGIKRFVADYIKNCAACQRYKAANLKPAGLLQTSVVQQRFETIAIDLFGPLPESASGKRWVFIIEDTCTRWVELFALERATAKECAQVLISEVFLRYGFCRRVISDNGPQFIGTVMQHAMCCLGIRQSLTPLYHPQANPVERRNRDLKAQLAILVGNEHQMWPEKLAVIRFSMNSVICQATGHSPSYLTFGRELRTPDDVERDMRAIITSENFVSEITPYLVRMVDTMREVRDTVEREQTRRKIYADDARRSGNEFHVGDYVWVSTHTPSEAAAGRTAKLNARRDGPYVICKVVSPTSYEVAEVQRPGVSLGKHHVSALTPYHGPVDNVIPEVPIRRRGRPRTS